MYKYIHTQSPYMQYINFITVGSLIQQCVIQQRKESKYYCVVKLELKS